MIGPDEAHPQDEAEERHEVGAGVPWGGIIIVIGVILLVVFSVQNTQSTSLEFLWLTADFPLAIVILVTAVVAALVAVTAGALYRRSRRRRRAERTALRELRGDD